MEILASAFTKILEGFNVNILIYDKYLEKYPYKSNMKSIYENADILSLHIPLNHDTKYLISQKTINKFKNHFIC